MLNVLLYFQTHSNCSDIIICILMAIMHFTLYVRITDFEDLILNNLSLNLGNGDRRGRV